MGELDNEYINLSNRENIEFYSRYNIVTYFLMIMINSDWLVLPLEGHEKVPYMLPLEDNDEIKEKD